MKNTSLKKKLKENKLTIGSWLTIGHPAVAEILCNYPFDWLTIDIEHNMFDPSQIRSLISIIQSKDKAALVRVSKNEEVVIKHVLDAGADGVIVPMVNSKDDAQKAVEFVYYPPLGKRGVGLSRAQNYGNGFENYKKWLKENVVIVAQIEHIHAIENLEEIAEVKGIDAMIIGPYDMSASMGYPGEFDLPMVKEAMDKFTKICESRKMPRGMHIVPIEEERYYTAINQGYSFIAYGTDFMFLNHSLAQLPS